MNCILFDGAYRERLLPFTYTKPVADIRIGIFTIREKWEKYLKATTSTLTEEYLEKKYPMVEMEHNIFIDSSYIPTNELFKKVSQLKEKQFISFNDEIVAFYSHYDQEEVNFETYENIKLEKEVLQIKNNWEIFSYNEIAFRQDFEWVLENSIRQEIPNGVIATNPEQIFIEEGAVVHPCFLNATNGPIYIASGAIILDGAMINGCTYIGEKSLVKMGAKIYGTTTVGPNCKVGGEIKNVVFFGNSNKGHEGYLGNSVVGEWCNFGASTSASNLKNTCSNVLLWDYVSESYEKTHQQLCGLMMGDFAKTGINTMLNTGTVVGVSAHIFGSGFPEKFIPSFSWGGKQVMDTYKLKKAIQTALKTLQLSKEELTSIDVEILESIYEQSKKYR